MNIHPIIGLARALPLTRNKVALFVWKNAKALKQVKTLGKYNLGFTYIQYCLEIS
jgi:hypothetical protein